MRKASKKGLEDELRPEYDLAKLKGGVRGKYFQAATAGSNLVLIEPDLAKVFPDAASVNRALRLLAQAGAAIKTPPKHGRRSTKPVIRRTV